MAERPVAESVKRMARDAINPTTGAGVIIRLSPIDGIIYVQVNAGTVATPVTVPAHIPFATLGVGMSVSVNLAQQPALLLGVTSGASKIPPSTSQERRLNAQDQRITQLEVLVAALIARENEGDIASRLTQSLSDTANQGAGNVTQEVVR